MIFLISVPFWLWLLLWIFTAPGRAAARYAAAREAATARELQIVAAMTEDMKAEYWERKRAEIGVQRPPMSGAKAVAILLLVFIAIFAVIVVVGIHNNP